MAMMAILLLFIFILNPFSIYITNIDQFTSSLFEVMKLCLIPMLISFLLFLPVFSLIPAGSLERFTALLATLSILVWFQGSVLLWDYGILDGRNIAWGEYKWQGWVDGFIWLAALILANRYYAKTGIIFVKSAFFIFVLQLVTLCYTGYDNWDLVNKKNSHHSIADPTEIFKFSNNNNILHIVVDGFQSDVFDELLHHNTLQDEYQQNFQGFTYYRETLGVFPYTIFSIPAFLAGKVYSNNSPRDLYVDNVLKGPTILSVASAENYEIDIASGDDYLINRYSNLPFHNIYQLDNVGITAPKMIDAAVALELGLFRILPHFLKKYVYNNQKWLVPQLFVSNQLFQFNYFSHTYFLNLFSEAMSAKREKPVYKYLHILNTHNPMVVDEQCEFAGTASRMERTSLTIQSKCTLDTLSALFAKMKDIGVYDSALIIVHGDHGGWVPNYRQGPPVMMAANDQAPLWLTSLASPLLAIKKPYDKTAFKVSTRLASLLDIPATISDIMDWTGNFEYQSLENESLINLRKRIFRFYRWQRDTWETDYTGPIQEYSIEGSHYESVWVPGNIFYPPK